MELCVFLIILDNMVVHMTINPFCTNVACKYFILNIILNHINVLSEDIEKGINK